MAWPTSTGAEKPAITARMAQRDPATLAGAIDTNASTDGCHARPVATTWLTTPDATPPPRTALSLSVTLVVWAFGSQPMRAAVTAAVTPRTLRALRTTVSPAPSTPARRRRPAPMFRRVALASGVAVPPAPGTA